MFEAVGNVVVVNGKDTLYGEAAHFDRRTMVFKIEGNVRFIAQGLTLYGSRLEYQAATGYAEVEHARIIHPQFNIIARKIIRRAEKVYDAKEAEFTTCRDCVESWSIYGKKIVIYLDDRAEIHHGLAKVKGVSLLYLPYLVVPMSKRKTGLIFPNVTTRPGEGFALLQPVFFAIDPSKDLTISPATWGKRGYGTDVQYRQRFGTDRWFMGDSRFVQDSIYEPGKSESGPTGSQYSRRFSELESHWLWSPNWQQHIRSTDTRDLDIVRTFQPYTQKKIIGSDLGTQGHLDGRGDRWALSIQGTYLRNQLVSDPQLFDRGYVQTLPRVALGSTPVSLVQSKVPGFRHIMIGADGSYTRFRQLNSTDDLGGSIRNADRVTANPYLNWNLFSWGPLGVKTEARLDYQKYTFPELQQSHAEKNATLMKTEVSFTMDRVFGLAYQERLPWSDLSDEDREQLKRNDQAPRPLSKSTTKRHLVGTLPSFDASSANDDVVVGRQAYRHSQEFKFIHHYITSQHQSGDARFLNQIQSNVGWFDSADAIRSKEYLAGTNNSRVIMPPSNTMEFQWNNVLIRKDPKARADWRTDQRYLRDNFTYSKIGYFNMSQGYLVNGQFEDYRERLTRLAILTGYTAPRWSVGVQEYFFHLKSQNQFQTNFQRQFNFLHLLTSYSYNDSNPNQRKQNALGAGMSLRPIDTIGVSYFRQLDLEASSSQRNIRTVYALDIMPNNDCWILSLNYQVTQGLPRYFFNLLFNFGDDKFQNYRRDWFRLQRY